MAQAQVRDRLAACAGHSPDATVASRVAACNALIATPGLPPKVVATAYFIRANTYAGLRDYERAIQDYDQALQLLPGDPLVLNDRCWVRAAANLDLEAALADCDEVVRRQPASAVAHDSRAFVLLRLGRYAEAIRDYDASLEINGKPNSVQASSLFGRGVAEERSGDATDADVDIQMAETIAPKIGETFASYGVQP